MPVEAVVLPACRGARVAREPAERQARTPAEPVLDREYAAHMLSDHRKDVSEFRKEADQAKDSDVKAFAGKTRL